MVAGAIPGESHRLTNEVRLVPRLRLGTHCPAGSACRASGAVVQQVAGRGSRLIAELPGLDSGNHLAPPAPLLAFGAAISTVTGIDIRRIAALSVVSQIVLYQEPAGR